MTALASLSDLPPNAQKDALASVTRSLLPHPDDIADSPTQQVSLELERRVIDEIRHRLHLKPDDNSTSAQTKIFNYISKTLSSLILQESDVSTIRARLGDRGNLPAREYKLQYPRDFVNFQKAFGIRPNHVTETLRNPDHVQHLTPDKEAPPGAFEGISFYSTTHATDTKDPFSLLVQCIRQKDVQEVYGVWRIYHSDILMPEDFIPLSVFRAFISVFGENVSMANQPLPPFLLFESFPGDIFPDSNLARNQNLEKWRAGTSVQRFRSRYRPDNDVSYVSIAYAVNLPKYCEALLLRGLPIHPELIEWGSFEPEPTA